MAIDKSGVKDKSPLVDETHRHTKKSRKKRFAIERRFVGELPGWVKNQPHHSFIRKWYESRRFWHVYRRYETEIGAIAAAWRLSGRDDGYEYRKAI